MEYPVPAPGATSPGAFQRQAPPEPPTARSSRAASPDELFRFHPRASNPELWRTTLPLIVRERCERHKGLIATWTAIHWLIVAYAGTGRCAFGMREIAHEAGVGRNELAGPKGYIQRLVGLGLLRIVGYEPVPGVKEPRPIYHVDLAELERLSLDLIPTLLRERHLPPPPRPAPDPRQLALFSADAHENGTAAPPPTQAVIQTMHENGAVERRPGAALLAPAYPTHENGTVARARRASTHENGTAALVHDGLPALPGAGMHENGTVAPQSEPDRARNRDVERMREEKERESEIAHAHDFQQIVAATAQAVILVLQQQGIVSSPASAPSRLDQPPRAPAGEPDLRASVAELWRGDREQVSQRELNQLTVIASSYDSPTGGYGAYWLGRAIFLADLCLSERGRPLTLGYVRSMLRRWAQEGSWGSDLAGEYAGETAGPSLRPRLRLPRAQGARSVSGASDTSPAEVPAAAADEASATQASAPADVAPVTSDTEHPAIAAYRAAFGREPNRVQAEQIAATVTDLAVWQRVLTDWQANGWQPGAVAKMLDRYRKDAGTVTPAASERAPSVRVIHTYPGLDLDQRERWIRRFHAATTPAEKRAVLARLEQEHPR